MKELEKDMGLLRNGMKEVEREIEFFRTQPAVQGDRYLQVGENEEIYSLSRYKLIYSAGDERILIQDLSADRRAGGSLHRYESQGT